MIGQNAFFIALNLKKEKNRESHAAFPVNSQRSTVNGQ